MPAVRARPLGGVGPTCGDRRASWRRTDKARTPFLLSLLLLVPACGGGGGSDPGEPPRITYYVDADNGSDASPGTASEPFETITHALTVVRSTPVRNGGDQVSVLPGTYDDAKETFPLVVPNGVDVLGSGLPAAQILGGGTVDPSFASDVTAAIVLTDGAPLGNVRVTNTLTSGDPGFHFGVLVAGDDAHINVVELSSSVQGGVRVVQGTLTEIAACEIHGHVNGIGIHFAGGGLDGRVRICDIHGNRIGVEYDAPGAVLNGAAVTTLSQENSIHGNLHTDLWILPGVTVDAGNNFWDHAPPTITTSSNTGGGVDIYHIDGFGGVDVTGAQVVTP